MALHSLELSNLKCFSALRLALSPLTLFTGFNAAGKSTALHALLLLNQGLRLDASSAYLPLNGPVIRLGLSGDVLSDQAETRQIDIAVATREERIAWSFGLVAPTVDTFEPGKGSFRVGKVVHQIHDTDTRPREWDGTLWRTPDTDSPSHALIHTLKRIVFLNSERGEISDVYPSPGDVNVIHADVGSEGQYAPWWYAWAADDEIDRARRHPDEPVGSLRRQVNAYLNYLFPGARVMADKVEKTSLVRLGFRIGAKNDWCRPANVGYGLTYAFPILVAMLLAESGQVLIVESPEAHLHPRAQSRMGEILARIAAAGVQILVESHSDHVLNGIRLAVQRRIIPHADVAVHFFSGVESDSGQHGVVSPTMDKDGTFDAWPDGFFDQSESDLAALTGWDQPA